MTGLARLIVGYLVLPLPLFLLGWLRRPLGLALALLVVGAGAGLLRAAPPPGCPGGPGRPLGRVWPWALAVAMVWVALSGAGPLGNQRSDWVKHNAMLRDLIIQPWPVYYAAAPTLPEPDRAALVYYLGYYLPAAAWGKLFGWTAAYWFLFAWTVLGVTLVLLAFYRLVDVDTRLVLVLFVFMSGLDVLWSRLGVPPLGGRMSGIPASWAVRYVSSVEHLAWVPQHALAGWLATAVTIEQCRRWAPPTAVGLLLVAAAFWSPFVSVGLLPWALYWIARDPAPRLPGWGNRAVCPLVALVLAAFLTSAADPPRLTFVGWEFLGRYWHRFAIFLVLQVGVYLVLCALALRRTGDAPTLLGIAGGVLMLIPFGRMGIYNDWVLRVSIPALFVLWILVAKVLLAGPAPYRLVVGLAFLVGAVQPSVLLTYWAINFRSGVPPLTLVSRVPDIKPLQVARQYIADRHALFFRYLADRR